MTHPAFFSQQRSLFIRVGKLFFFLSLNENANHTLYSRVACCFCSRSRFPYGWGLGTGCAEDVHGHVHVNHRTGRMMPDPRQLTDTAAAAAPPPNGVRGLSLDGASAASSSRSANALGWSATEEEEFDEPEEPPRAVSARFQLTELGPRVTRIHRPSGSGDAS